MIKILITLLASLLAAPVSDKASIQWSAESAQVEENIYEITLSGVIESGYYTHPMEDAAAGVTLEFNLPETATLDGEPVEEYIPSLYKGTKVVQNSYKIKQKIKAVGKVSISGTVGWSSCTGDQCRMPEDWDFELTLSPASHTSTKGNLWALILEAILWGLAMLLTPCVFPMVPMTVSFFIKGSPSKANGKFKAAMYGLFIVLLYTVPICIIIGATRILGGETVTADIFNWLATHWLPNILFFVIFMVFAASFFGAFELTLPSKWVNSSDSKSDKGGLGGIFFLALTLVLVSFSCTGPIVGTVLIKSTSGEFWAPMVTMLAFSIAFALPFTVLAFFPSLLKNLPKSGGWLNSVKVVLGFIELALGLKFLSVADQTYHWHLLDREVYLAIWIVCFSLLGFYLLGKLRFAHDDKLEYISVKRLILSIAVFSFVVYMIPGMWGAPLKALSGYLPPLETQDFIIGQYSQSASAATGVVPPANSLGEGAASLPEGGAASLPEGGANSLPEGGAATLPEGGVNSFPEGSVNSLSEGGVNSFLEGGAASLPEGGANSFPEGGAAVAGQLYGNKIKMPHGLEGYDNLEDALAVARSSSKKVFVDITGYGCVNCREMEARVWSDPEVLRLLKENFVIAALYNDDKTKLPESKWFTTPEGKVLKDVGRVNSYIARSRFGVNAQPNYALLDSEGKLLVPVRGYDLSISGFVEFLKSVE